VRVFSNVKGDELVLPSSEGYTLCRPCQRYVGPTNRHCPECDRCTSKDGRRWVHCRKCSVCVKPGRVHCAVCRRCQPPRHECDAAPLSTGRCHVCGSAEHRRAWHDSHPTVTAAVAAATGVAQSRVNPKRRRVTTATEEWEVTKIEAS
jgi:hypothetical protein